MGSKQMSFAENGFEKFRKPTRREHALRQLDERVPWKKLCDLIEPFYPKGGKPGRPPVGLERMLRIH
jgi:IS5 family transposase